MKKSQALLKLWCGYPSLLSVADSQAKAMLTEWAETAANYSDEIVDAACLALKKRNTAFAPSTGQLFAELERAAADEAERHRIQCAALPPPEYPPEHRERMAERLARVRAEILAGTHEDYGHVAPGTRPQRPIVRRVVAPSWLDEWEKINRRPYPARDAVLDRVGKGHRPEAA